MPFSAWTKSDILWADNDNRQIKQKTSKIRKERGRLPHILIICTAGSKKMA